MIVRIALERHATEYVVECMRQAAPVLDRQLYEAEVAFKRDRTVGTFAIRVIPDEGRPRTLALFNPKRMRLVIDVTEVDRHMLRQKVADTLGPIGRWLRQTQADRQNGYVPATGRIGLAMATPEAIRGANSGQTWL